jgi:hypothetical protein
LRFENGWTGLKLIGQELLIPIDAYSAQTATKLDSQRVADAEKVEEQKVAKYNRAYKTAISQTIKGSDQYGYGVFESETPI